MSPTDIHAEDDSTSLMVRLGFVGDIFLGNWAIDFIDNEGFDYPFRNCMDMLQSFDLVVGNLECPITLADEPFIEKQYLLKAPPGIENGLFQSNIRAVNLANNHIMDFGLEGLESTIGYLKSSSIQHFGAGINLESALREARFSIHGKTIALLGFSATFPEEFWATDSTAGAAFAEENDVIDAVSRCVQIYDIVVVSFHWSAERLEFPKDYQIELAHLCIDYGADMVVGHHPHVVQGVEVYKRSPIFYSLGNFSFASYSENARTGLFAAVAFSYQGVVKASVIPINVYNTEVFFQPDPLRKKQSIEFFHWLNQISEPLNNGKDIVSKDGGIILEGD